MNYRLGVRIWLGRHLVRFISHWAAATCVGNDADDVTHGFCTAFAENHALTRSDVFWVFYEPEVNEGFITGPQTFFGHA